MHKSFIDDFAEDTIDVHIQTIDAHLPDVGIFPGAQSVIQDGDTSTQKIMVKDKAKTN